MFPIDKRTVIAIWFPAPDVVPALCSALDDIPLDTWNAQSTLEELADAVEPYLAKHGGRRWDFVWAMERHFSEPYGPLPKATTTFMAGIPDMFLTHGAGLPETDTTSAGQGGILEAQAHLNKVVDDGVERVAEPFQYDAGSDMPAEYRQWLEKLFFAHGECMIPYFGEEAEHIENMYDIIDAAMIRQAPDAKSRLRFANFTNEEMRHTFQFYELYSAYDEDLPRRIYEHETAIFRAYMDYKTDGTWADYTMVNLMGDRLGTYQAFEWVQSSYAPLARVALKVVKDERGHGNMGYLNVRDFLEKNGAEGRAHIQKRIDEHFYPYHLAAFGGATSRNSEMWRRMGLKQRSNEALRQAYHSEMQLVLDSLGLECPDYEDATARGMEAAVEARRAAEQSQAAAE